MDPNTKGIWYGADMPTLHARTEEAGPFVINGRTFFTTTHYGTVHLIPWAREGVYGAKPEGATVFVADEAV